MQDLTVIQCDITQWAEVGHAENGRLQFYLVYISRYDVQSEKEFIHSPMPKKCISKIIIFNFECFIYFTVGITDKA